ncbi:hypothetical protein LCGC14_1761320 [marine sediment metagenome]|uniref:Uncharacterized protein n=1 Tax=marine sediment metagenome TaxID=412755 RepID=A0A0F9HNB5_9ZZZZ
MLEKVITDNTYEKVTARWDGERFALVWESDLLGTKRMNVILLNTREMAELVEFVKEIK